jgi:uncharacterized protein YqjF (DUF2071 family)
MPDRPWAMTQTWNDLLFAHWRVDPGVLRNKIPPEFDLDLFGGAAWIGIVPFYMTNVSFRRAPWVSQFAELNVRTYVQVDDRPGVYFFSLDAASWLAARTARLWLNLPYHSATMARICRDGRVSFRSDRADGNARFVGTYTATGSGFTPVLGSLDYFLTERYCLYHRSRRGKPYRLEIHHPPWRLHPADADISLNTMAAAAGLDPADHPPLLHYVRRQDMVAWPPSSL